MKKDIDVTNISSIEVNDYFVYINNNNSIILSQIIAYSDSKEDFVCSDIYDLHINCDLLSEGYSYKNLFNECKVIGVYRSFTDKDIDIIRKEYSEYFV